MNIRVALIVLAIGSCCLAQRASAVDLATAFGARESIESISLSPSGGRIAYVAPRQGQGSALYVVDLASGQSRLTTAVDGEKQRLGDCGWVSNDRLVCTVFALRRVQAAVGGTRRFVAIDHDGSDVVTLGDRDSETRYGAALSRVMRWQTDRPETVLMMNGTGVARIDTRSNRVEIVEDPITYAVDFLSDSRGRVRFHGAQRIMGETRMDSDKIDYRYRPSGSTSWQSFGVYNFMTRQGMNPLAIDAEGDAVFVLDKLNGRTALYRVALDGSRRRELVLSHKEVDVDDVVTLGRGGRVVGATYATEARKVVYFDATLRRLAEQLAKGLPNLPLVRFVGASNDESILLIWAGSDRDPGRYYTYRKDTRRLNEIMLARPQLEGIQLAEVRPIQFPAADGTLIPGYLTLPPAGAGGPLSAIVIPHGGPGSRDEWGFDWLAQYFAHRGFAVLQPNFRGSSGYGDEWFQRNGYQAWRTAIGDVADAGRWLVREGIANPSKLAIVGWSYGGYAALQSAVVEPDLFRAIVAVAPVTDLNRLREEYRGWSDFRLMRDFIGTGPHVREGSPAQNARLIRAPVLLFHGDHDSNVDVDQSRFMHDQLRSAGRHSELVVFRGLDHNLEDSEARAQMLRQTDAFIRRSLDLH